MSCHTPLLSAEGIIYCMYVLARCGTLFKCPHNQQRLAVLQLPPNQRGRPFQDDGIRNKQLHQICISKSRSSRYRETRVGPCTLHSTILEIGWMYCSYP